MSATDDRRRRLQGDLASRQQSMADRLVQTLADNLTERKPPPTLRREEPRGPIPPGRGRIERNYEPTRDPSTGTGVASPLIEGGTAGASPGDPVLDRTYYEPREVMTSDGLFVWEVTDHAIQTITLRDANDATVLIKLAQPEDPEP